MSGTVDRRIDARRTINHEFSSVEQFINEYVINLSRSGVFIKSVTISSSMSPGVHVASSEFSKY